MPPLPTSLLESHSLVFGILTILQETSKSKVNFVSSIEEFCLSLKSDVMSHALETCRLIVDLLYNSQEHFSHISSYFLFSPIKCKVPIW